MVIESKVKPPLGIICVWLIPLIGGPRIKPRIFGNRKTDACGGTGSFIRESPYEAGGAQHLNYRNWHVEVVISYRLLRPDIRSLQFPSTMVNQGRANIFHGAS